MNKDIISSATSKLELLNIVLHEAKLVRESDIDPLAYPLDLNQQSMLSVSSEEITYETEKDTIEMFRSFIQLGIRAVKETMEKEKKNIEVFYRVEATYRVDYLLKDKLTDDEAKEFSEFNSVHNVWPFWRQHVFEILRSAELPKLNIPLMKGMKVNKKNIKKQVSN